MNNDLLTRVNTHITRPIMDAFDVSEASASTRELPADVACYVRDSLAPNSRRAYVGDIAHFFSWGGTVPASDRMVAEYIAAYANTHAVATLIRRLASISKAHKSRGLASPTGAELVKATLGGIKRTHGRARHEAKPLLREDLFLALDKLSNGSKDVRDRAMLLVGFAGGFRRSELVGIERADIEHVRQGLFVTLRRSKTDQTRVGRKIAIPHGRTRHCPVAALTAWLSLSKTELGPVFRPVDRHGHIQLRRLSGEAVSLVVRERVDAAGINSSGFSGHSLRAGFATSAALAGVASWKIRQQTGHASDAMLERYIRDEELFMENAAGALL